VASLLAFDAYATDWLNLLTRWLHVIAGIVWIGSSFYFIALDNHLRPPKDPRDAEEGVGGETWEIHGGGFYNIKKYLVAPRILPETLHWFKWEAYTTWLSGFALMIVLYYLNADTYLIDKSVADLSTTCSADSLPSGRSSWPRSCWCSSPSRRGVSDICSARARCISRSARCSGR
jgi:uncharacterized membrane protein